jgi:hypothetical protein
LEIFIGDVIALIVRHFGTEPEVPCRVLGWDVTIFQATRPFVRWSKVAKRLTRVKVLRRLLMLLC